MIIERGSLFCDIALAGRGERGRAGVGAGGRGGGPRRPGGAAGFVAPGASEAAQRRRGDATGFVTPVAGGVASFAGPDSPFNKVAGLGFGGVPDTGDLAVIERGFAARGAPVQVELSHLADPEVGNLLTGR